ALTVIALTVLSILLVRARAATFRTKAPRLADAQVHACRSGTFRKVAGDHHIARRELELEVAKRRAAEVIRVRTINSRRRQRRPFGIERVAIEIAAKRDVERPAGLHSHERIERDAPRRAEVTNHHKAMTYIAGRASVFRAQVVGVRGETAGAVSIAV